MTLLAIFLFANDKYLLGTKEALRILRTPIYPVQQLKKLDQDLLKQHKNLEIHRKRLILRTKRIKQRKNVPKYQLQSLWRKIKIFQKKIAKLNYKITLQPPKIRPKTSNRFQASRTQAPPSHRYHRSLPRPPILRYIPLLDIDIEFDNHFPLHQPHTPPDQHIIYRPIFESSTQSSIQSFTQFEPQIPLSSAITRVEQFLASERRLQALQQPPMHELRNEEPLTEEQQATLYQWAYQTIYDRPPIDNLYLIPEEKMTMLQKIYANARLGQIILAQEEGQNIECVNLSLLIDDPQAFEGASFRQPVDDALFNNYKLYFLNYYDQNLTGIINPIDDPDLTAAAAPPDRDFRDPTKFAPRKVLELWFEKMKNTKDAQFEDSKIKLLKRVIKVCEDLKTLTREQKNIIFNLMGNAIAACADRWIMLLDRMEILIASYKGQDLSRIYINLIKKTKIDQMFHGAEAIESSLYFTILLNSALQLGFDTQRMAHEGLEERRSFYQILDDFMQDLTVDNLINLLKICPGMMEYLIAKTKPMAEARTNALDEDAPDYYERFGAIPEEIVNEHIYNTLKDAGFIVEYPEYRLADFNAIRARMR